MLYLTESEVRELLPMSEAVRLVRSAFVKLSTGEAINQPRRRLMLSTGAALHYMAGSDGEFFGSKIYSTHPKHGAHFVFLLYRAADAQPLAIIEANYLGQIRTGAASAVATDLMAPAGAGRLCVIGSGFQARSQIEALLAVRPIHRVSVWSRSEEKRTKFAAECSTEFGVACAAADSAERAVRDAEIVVTATSAKEPVFQADWLSPGVHINAMGSNQANRRELPGEAIRRAACIAVDSLEQARMESGDLILALDDDSWKTIVELKDVATGRIKARSRPDQLTIFKSLGLAVEDVAAAGYVYRKALERYS